jgi:hypothetical protein
VIVGLLEAGTSPGELRLHLFDLAGRVDAVRPLAVALAVSLVFRVLDELLELADRDFARAEVEPLREFDLVLHLLRFPARLALR